MFAPVQNCVEELALADEPDVRRLFAEERIKDLLLVTTYRANLPPWPA